MGLIKALFGTSSDKPLCPTCQYRVCSLPKCHGCINAIHCKTEDKVGIIRCYCTCKHDDYPAVTRCRHYCKKEDN